MTATDVTFSCLLERLWNCIEIDFTLDRMAYWSMAVCPCLPSTYTHPHARWGYIQWHLLYGEKLWEFTRVSNLISRAFYFFSQFLRGKSSREKLTQKFKGNASMCNNLFTDVVSYPYLFWCKYITKFCNLINNTMYINYFVKNIQTLTTSSNPWNFSNGL